MNFKKFIESFEDNGSGVTFWGKQASGVLPICPSTGRICLGLRSKNCHNIVNGKSHYGECYGIFGGALEGGSPESNAKKELHEETDFRGNLELISSVVYENGKFKYFNFLGIMENEDITVSTTWEHTEVEWFDFNNLNFNYPLHDGLKFLLERAKNQISAIIQKENHVSTLSIQKSQGSS